MNIFASFIAWAGIVIGGLKTFFTKYVEPAIKVVESIKAVVDNPELDILVELTKSTTDEKLLTDLRNGLSFALAELQGATNCVTEPDLPSQVECFIAFIKAQPAMVQDSLFHKLASAVANNLNQVAGNAALPDHQVQTLVQVGYANLKATGAVVASTGSATGK